MKKRLLSAAAAILLLLSVTACTKEQQGNVNLKPYEPVSETAAATTKYNENDLLNSDDTWQNKYALSYSFYDTKTGESQIMEGKCGKYYQAVDQKSGIITFISQEESYISEYILDSKTKTGTASVVANSTIDELYSGFSQFSTCDPYLPVYKNVTKFGTDKVANRSAVRYKQVETKDGKESRIAYIWIDDEYQFASKCELYDAQTQELLMRWELLSFTVNANEDAVKINLDEYTITNQET